MTHTGFDPVLSLHADAKAFPGGIAALAQSIGRSAGVLHNKFSEAVVGNEITDREADALALKIRASTGAQGYIESKCALHGGLFVVLPEDGMAADDDVLASMLDSMRSLGELARELSEARADGLITPDEFSAIELRARRLQASIQHAVATLRTQVVQPPQAMRSV